MQKIVSHLWFDKNAKEAAEFYVSVFGKDSKVKNISTIEDTPSGTVEIVSVEILGESFTLLGAGPEFKFNPSISFLVSCESKEEVDRMWNMLEEGGSPLMELGSYPFSERYGWIQDKFGLSWQIMYAGEQIPPQRIIPTLLFVGNVCEKAEEAINFYTSVFKESKKGEVMRYMAGEEPDKEGTLKFGSFTILGKEFAAMDSARMHDFSFNEAISFIVNCENQEEIDYYWEKLSAVPEAEQCGWLKDKFGISWQIVPIAMNEMLSGGDKEKIARVTETFLKMKKFDIAELERAARGE